MGSILSHSIQYFISNNFGLKTKEITDEKTLRIISNNFKIDYDIYKEAIINIYNSRDKSTVEYNYKRIKEIIENNSQFFSQLELYKSLIPGNLYRIYQDYKDYKFDKLEKEDVINVNRELDVDTKNKIRLAVDEMNSFLRYLKSSYQLYKKDKTPSYNFIDLKYREDNKKYPDVCVIDSVDEDYKILKDKGKEILEFLKLFVY